MVLTNLNNVCGTLVFANGMAPKAINDFTIAEESSAGW